MEWLEKGGGVIAADMLYRRLAISQESWLASKEDQGSGAAVGINATAHMVLHAFATMPSHY